MSDEFHTFQKGLSIELACEAVTWGECVLLLQI